MASSPGCLTLFGAEGEAAAGQGRSLSTVGFAAASPLPARPGEWYGSIVRVDCRGQATGAAVAGKRMAAHPGCLTLFSPTGAPVGRFAKSSPHPDVREGGRLENIGRLRYTSGREKPGLGEVSYPVYLK